MSLVKVTVGGAWPASRIEGVSRPTTSPTPTITLTGRRPGFRGVFMSLPSTASAVHDTIGVTLPTRHGSDTARVNPWNLPPLPVGVKQARGRIPPETPRAESTAKRQFTRRAKCEYQIRVKQQCPSPQGVCRHRRCLRKPEGVL